MSSPELPFVRRGGQDQATALFNRIAALERIKHLTGVDLRDKSTEYKQLIDCELYVKFYKDEPLNQPIDELWCQRVADVVRELEKTNQLMLDKSLVGVPDRVKQLYAESKLNIPEQNPAVIEKKEVNRVVQWIKRFIPKKV